jgi:O-antigen/teichoic acid export membrane protein
VPTAGTKVLSTFGTKAVVLPITSVCSLGAAAITVSDVGRDRFGLITVVTTLALLIPFADLGMSAALVNAFAERRPNRAKLLRVAWTYMWIASLVLLATVWLIQTLFGWSDVLGGNVPEYVVVSSLSIFILSVPLGVGGRILVGLGRLPLLTVLQALFPVLTLAMTVGVRLIGPEYGYYLVPGVAQLVTTATILACAYAIIDDDSNRWLPSLGRHGEFRLLFSQGASMMLITLGLALSFQSDRLVLSHVSTSAALGTYAILMTLYAPTWALLSTAGMALWPHFASGGSESRLLAEFHKQWRTIALLASCLAAGLTLLGPTVTSILFGDGLSFTVWAAAAALLLAQAAHLPSGMYLTSASGLRFQAFSVVAMTITNLALSIALAPRFGAVGPLLGSAVAVAACQGIPCYLRVRQEADRSGDRRLHPAASDDDRTDWGVLPK